MGRYKKVQMNLPCRHRLPRAQIRTGKNLKVACAEVKNFYEKSLVAWIKSNLLLKNQMYNISSLQLNTIKTD